MGRGRRQVREPQQLPFGLLLRGFAGFEEEDLGSSTALRNDILALASRIPPQQLVTLSGG